MEAKNIRKQKTALAAGSASDPEVLKSLMGGVRLLNRRSGLRTFGWMGALKGAVS
jgi:hypothetical protein